MTCYQSDPGQLEQLFRRNLLSRRQFITALAALGVTASGIEGLFGPTLTVQAEGTLRSVAPHDRYLVVIVMDGFRADCATLAPMHHLHALMGRGMTYDTAWVGHLESETPTGHATIATGVYPRKHGVIGFGWRDVATGVFTFMPTDLRQIRSGDLTQTIVKGRIPTIPDLIRRRRQSDLTVSLSGEKYFASASMGAGANYVPYGKEGTKGAFRPVSIGPTAPPPGSHYSSVRGESDFSSQDLFSAEFAVQLARTLRPRALLVNLPDVDIAGHYFGGMCAPQDMTPIIKGADFAIGRIVAEYRRRGLLERTIFVVTADHGMAANRHIIPIHSMYRTAAAHASGGTLDEEFRVSMGSVWLRQPTDDRSVASALVAQHFAGVESALYKVASGPGWVFAPDPSTSARLGLELTQAYLNLADTEACPAGPEVILPYGEDTMGLTVKGSTGWGTHGGFSWGVQHIPLAIAGPGVSHGLSHVPAKLVDIAPTTERLLGLPIPAGVDGVVLADAVQDATVVERSAQKVAGASRQADVRALRGHSLAQSTRGE